MGRMHVTDFETGAFPRQTTRPESGYPAFMCDLRQRIILVHELRQLAGTEKFLDHGGHRFGIDDFLWHQTL